VEGYGKHLNIISALHTDISGVIRWISTHRFNTAEAMVGSGIVVSVSLFGIVYGAGDAIQINRMFAAVF